MKQVNIIKYEIKVIINCQYNNNKKNINYKKQYYCKISKIFTKKVIKKQTQNEKKL